MVVCRGTWGNIIKKYGVKKYFIGLHLHLVISNFKMHKIKK